MPTVITWNMEGSSHSGNSKWTSGVTPLLAKFNPDVVCLQESGQVPPTGVAYAPPPPIPPWLGAPPPALVVWGFYTWNLGTGTRPNIYYLLWVQTDPGGNRVNIAVLTRALPVGLWYIPNPIAAGRPAIGIETPANEHIFSLHAFSGGGGDAPGLVAAAAGAVPAGDDWVTAGDLNREPNTWPVPTPVGTLCPPNQYTRWKSQKKLDYALRNGAAVTGGVVNSLTLSDHYPVVFDF